MIQETADLLIGRGGADFPRMSLCPLSSRLKSLLVVFSQCAGINVLQDFAGWAS
jgi:hypothetical protein